FVDDSTLTDSSATIGPLTNCQHYFWRVSAKNAQGTSAFSPFRDFFAPTVLPEAPALIGPPDRATGLPPSVSVSWEDVDICARRYVVTAAFDSLFTNIFRSDTVAAKSESLPPLGGETDIYWKVVALN